MLVADEQDAEALELLGYPVLVDDQSTGIAERRQWILERHTDESDGDYIIMMDDDLGFAKRRVDEPTKFRKFETAKDFDMMMDRLLRMMTWCSLGSIRSRGGANRNENPAYIENTRVHEVLVIDAMNARQRGYRFDRTEFMEDFDFVLQHLTSGQRTLTLNAFVKDDLGGSNSAGGCSTYRDELGQLDAAMELSMLYPEFVTVVERPGWSGMGDTRTDVRVQWAKAYTAGVEAHGEQDIPVFYAKRGS